MNRRLLIGLVLLAATIFPRFAVAAIYYADTNGDGYQDEITTSYDWLYIRSLNTGAVRNYYLGPYTYVKAADTDGQVGAEVVVFSGNNTTLGNHAVIVDDRRRVTRSYSLTSTFKIHFVVDTNGAAGAEIVASVANGYVRIIRDATVSYYDYDIKNPYSSTTTTSVFGYADTDGYPGAEVVLWRNDNSVLVIHDNRTPVKTYSVPTLFQIRYLADTNGVVGSEIIITRNDNIIETISDRTGTRRQHYIGSGFSLYDVRDTNGLAGNEIIVGQTISPYDTKIILIDEAKRGRVEYPINATFSVVKIANLDGINGVEICYSAYTPIKYMIIVDRLGYKVLSSSSTGCAM